MKKALKRKASTALLASMAFACSTAAHHPCQEGGEPARAGKWPGNRKCEQTYVQAVGKHLNDGKYIDWYPSGKRALVGEYKMGKKHGAWTEYDEAGKKLWEKWYIDGQEVSRIEMDNIPGVQAAPPAPPPPRMSERAARMSS